MPDQDIYQIIFISESNKHYHVEEEKHIYIFFVKYYWWNPFILCLPWFMSWWKGSTVNGVSKKKKVRLLVKLHGCAVFRCLWNNSLGVIFVLKINLRSTLNHCPLCFVLDMDGPFLVFLQTNCLHIHMVIFMRKM